MRVLGFDLETTGLDTGNDRIIELGYCLWEVEAKRPLAMIDVFLRDDTYPPVPEEITRITGIDQGMLDEFGTSPKENLGFLEQICREHKPDYLVAHNGNNFDFPLLRAEIARNGVEAPCLLSLPTIDTRTDIPFATEPDSRKLKHLALDIGVINHFPHRAVTDVLTMLLVLAHYDIEKVLEYAKIPWITIRAVVSYDDREKAKARRYSWENIGEKKYPKCWVKRIKENELEREKKEAPFQIGVLDRV